VTVSSESSEDTSGDVGLAKVSLAAGRFDAWDWLLAKAKIKSLRSLETSMRALFCLMCFLSDQTMQEISKKSPDGGLNKLFRAEVKDSEPKPKVTDAALGKLKL